MGLPPTSPGGQKRPSKAKQARLAALSQAQANAAPPPTVTAPTTSEPPHKKARTGPAPPAFSHRQQQQQQKQSTPTPRAPLLPSTSTAAVTVAQGVPVAKTQQSGGREPPYNVLDESIATGPLARVLAKAPPATVPSVHQKGSRAAPHGAKGADRATGISGEGTLDMLVEVLLRTNPALQGSADARATAGLRVQDKSILLDNPPSTTGQRTKAAARQAPGYSKQLASKRKLGTPVIKQGDVRYSQLLPLYHIWLKYVASQLNHVLPHTNEGASMQQQQNTQQKKKQKGQAQEQPATANTSTAHSQPAPTAPHPPPLRQLSPTETAAARMQLSRCELHGSILQVVKSPNPRLVGCQGIVAQVTARAVCVVDANDHVHVVPKQGTTFASDLSAFGLPLAALFEGSKV